MDKIDMINQADNAGNVKYGGNRDKGKALTGFRTVLLRLLSSLAVHMYLYACFTLIRRVLFYDDGGAISVVIYACSAVSAWLAGTLLIGRSCYYSMKLSQVRLSRFIAFSLGIRDMDRAISALTAWLLMIVPAAAPFVIFREYGVLKPLFESAAAACAYIVALKHTQKSPAGIINGGGFYAGLVLLATCLELPYFVDGLSYLRPWFFGALYFLILIYLLVRNQKDIDENIYDKKFVEKSILPKNLRRFNTVSIIFRLSCDPAPVQLPCCCFQVDRAGMGIRPNCWQCDFMAARTDWTGWRADRKPRYGGREHDARDERAAVAIPEPDF